MGRKVLPDKLVERLDRENKTNAQIVEYLAEHEHIYVTRQAISQWRVRRGDERRRALPKTLPWNVRPEHAHSALAKAVRFHEMLQRGMTLSEGERARYDRVMDRLAQDDAVVHYDPKTEQGWFLVKRREGVDHGIIREPTE